jgi:hypothetical protein
MTKILLTIPPGVRVDVEINGGTEREPVKHEEESACEFCETDAHDEHAERCPISLESEIEGLRAELSRTQQQLPATMQGCKFEEIKCYQGHRRIQPTNWTDFGCRQCLIEDLTKQNIEFGNAIRTLEANAKPHTVRIDQSANVLAVLTRPVKSVHDGIVEC